jgi:hypothetical protein
MHIMLTVMPDPDRARRQVRAGMRGKFLRLYVLGGALVAIGAGVVVQGMPAGYALLAIGVALASFPWLLPRAASKARTGLLAEPVTYELTDTSVVARTPSLRNSFTWAAVERIEDSAEFWVLMVKGVGVLALPWTLFRDADVDQARAFLTTRGLLTAKKTPAAAR